MTAGSRLVTDCPSYSPPARESSGIADLRAADNSGGTPLHLAVDRGYVQIAGLLIARGAEVNARFTGPHTETPLHWAASSDDVEVVEVGDRVDVDRLVGAFFVFRGHLADQQAGGKKRGRAGQNGDSAQPRR